MKTIELLIDEEADNTGIQAVSLVRFPAIEENFVYFGADTNRYVLAKVDEEKQMLVGPALIPEKRIGRLDDITGEEYEVFFSAETVRVASEKYMKEERTNQHTYEHEVPIDGVTVVESWLIEDPARDKSSLYGFKLPKGTWMLSVKVHNEAVWAEIKNGDFRGFSIEGYFIDALFEASARKPCASCPDDPAVLTELREVVMEEMSPVMLLDGEPLWETQQEAELYGELFRNCVGSHTHNINDTTLYMACATHPEKLDDEEGDVDMKHGGPCWEGYEMIGWKMKNGKKVPNCVPKD